MNIYFFGKAAEIQIKRRQVNEYWKPVNEYCKQWRLWLQREWSVVHFPEDHTLCYVPSSWVRRAVVAGRDEQQRQVFRCYWPTDVDDIKIRSLIRSCSQPDRETWDLLRCKRKGVYQSTDEAERAMRELEGTDSTTDTDAVNQCDDTSDTGDGLPESPSFLVDPTITMQLLQRGTEGKLVSGPLWY